MIKLFTLFGILTFSLSSFAIVDFNGHWKADSGMMTKSKGQKTPCTNIEVTMIQAEGKLTTQSYKAKCGYLETDWGPDPMILGGEIVFNVDHKEIGTLKGDTLITSEAIGGAVYAFNLKLKNDNGKPILQSYYGTKNLLGAIVVEESFLQQ